MKRKIVNILWIISMLTWALPLNIIYTLVLVEYLIAWNKRILKFKYVQNRLVVVVKGDDYFGGLELGYAVLISENERSLNHELGHTLQGAIWGIFFLFVIAIPSAIRYNYRNYLRKNNANKYIRLKSYDSIWFEKQATKWGNNLYNI